MPDINPTTILQGPCIMTYDGATFYSEGNVEITEEVEELTVKVSGFPDIEDRVFARLFKIGFKPAGEWRDLSVCYPDLDIGDHLFSSEALVIWSRESANNKRTYHNAAVTKYASVATGVEATMLGDMEFTAVLAVDKEPGEAGAYFTIATDTFPSETFDPSKVLTPVIALAIGASSPWNALNTETVPVFDFAIKVRPVKVSGRGTVSMVLTGKTGTVKFVPVGVTEAEVNTLRGTGLAAGARPTTLDVVASGTGIHITLYKAQFKGGNFNYGTDKNRIGEITGKATQTFSAGAGNPLWRIAEAAPV